MPRSILPSVAVLTGRGTALRPVLFDSDGLEIDERVEFSGMCSTGFAYRFLRDAEAQMVRLAQTILVRTSAARAILMARGGPLVGSDAFFIVGNGRDDTVFHPFDEAARLKVRAELRIASDAPLVLYVGSVGGGKYLVSEVGAYTRALRRTRSDTQLLILSGSPDMARAELLGRFAELEGCSTIMRVEPADVPRFVAAADIGTAFIKPTFSMRSVSPVKTGEYLLCGVPVVGTAEVGDNGPSIAQGVFFDQARGMDEAARWALDTVLPNRALMRERARSVGVAEYSLQKSVLGYVSALNHIKAVTGAGCRGGHAAL
jgi:hypothetical protein